MTAEALYIEKLMKPYGESSKSATGNDKRGRDLHKKKSNVSES